MARSRFASSMKGRFSASDITFHSAPSRLLISELCILGFSCAIFLRCPRDHTMNAFIGLFTRSWFALDPLFGPVCPVVVFVWGPGECRMNGLERRGSERQLCRIRGGGARRRRRGGAPHPLRRYGLPLLLLQERRMQGEEARY
ncbi:hypothetical protein EYF80_055425 [Liparis tanakae]|uniref:Uncharacterized protein n=1 Tax=Liparis tanakae TaxID=230148 RepID=A0A4Z2EZX0_9TELE|nr:hypothetical protein EYF80_055425 [Liparis tanakae]